MKSGMIQYGEKYLRGYGENSIGGTEPMLCSSVFVVDIILPLDATPVSKFDSCNPNRSTFYPYGTLRIRNSITLLR